MREGERKKHIVQIISSSNVNEMKVIRGAIKGPSDGGGGGNGTAAS